MMLRRPTTAVALSAPRGRKSLPHSGRLLPPPHTTLFGTPDYKTVLQQQPPLEPEQTEGARKAVLGALAPLLLLEHEGSAWSLQWNAPRHQDPELRFEKCPPGPKEQSPAFLPSVLTHLEQAGFSDVTQLSNRTAQCRSADDVRVVVKVRGGHGTTNNTKK